jgi:cytidylate kinase
VDADVLDSDCLIHFTKKVLEEAAEAGNCVIVGRAAPYYLRKRHDKYCVFLYAPRDYRFHRVMGDVKDEAKAVDLVDNVDAERAEFIKHYFGVQWPSRPLYDCMLNTSIGDDATVETILHLMDQANQREAAIKS